jgi:hypothetical protein
MKRIALMWIVLTGALLAPTGGFAQVSCTREGLQRAVDLYIAAQTKGDTSGMPMSTRVGYWENVAPGNINTGIIKTPMKIDFHRSLLDVPTCQTFTEVIVTNKEKPYVLGTRLRVNHDKIAELEIIWTAPGYWLFNADRYLEYSSSEKWDTIPKEKRDTRDTLVSAANAYLDAFLEQKIDLVPWGYPCNRTEGGGMRTGRGQATDSCSDGVPANVNISNRRFVVDDTIGSVVVYCTFPPGGWQAAVRAHADPSAAVGFPGWWRRRAAWWSPARWSGRSRRRPQRWSRSARRSARRWSGRARGSGSRSATPAVGSRSDQFPILNS